MAVRAPVDTFVPEVPLAPVHAPLAVHPVVFAEDHVSVLEPPIVTVVGFALIEIVGTGSTLAIAD